MKLTGSEFRLFAEECVACAREATTEERRTHHLAMAKMWSTAAGRLEGDSAAQIERKNSAIAWDDRDL